MKEKNRYKTQKGEDNSLIGEISPGVTVHLHNGHLFARGGGFNTNNLDRILREISEDRLVFLAFTGSPGTGKTFFALRLAELLDPKFKLRDSPAPPGNQDDSQVAFDRDHLNHLLSPESTLKEYQCVVVDESHFGLGSRSWQKSIQQDIVNLLVACRSKRIIFMVVALNITQIDKYLRDFVVNYQFTLEDRGRATLYRRYFHKIQGDPLIEKMDPWILPLPWVERCENPDCIGCPFLFEDRKGNPDGIRCPNPRALYERRKLEFLNKQTSGSKDNPDGKRKPERSDIAEELKEHVSKIPKHKREGRIVVFRGQLADFVKKTLGYKLSAHDVTAISGIIEESKWWVDYTE